MRGSLVLAGFCAAVLSAACGQTTSPAGPSAVRSDVLSSARDTGPVVPFKGRLEGRYGTPTGTFPIIHESIVATGEATQLGRYALEVAETVDLQQASATGSFTFTAADGDTVYGSYTGHAQLRPLVAIKEDATILGGTGRFDGATGHFTIDRLFDPVNLTTTGSFEGTISSPGARHD